MGISCRIHTSIFFISISNNDRGALNISGLEENLQELLTNYAIDDKNSLLLSTYADRTYKASSIIITHIGNRKAVN